MSACSTGILPGDTDGPVGSDGPLADAAGSAEAAGAQSETSEASTSGGGGSESEATTSVDSQTGAGSEDTTGSESSGDASSVTSSTSGEEDGDAGDLSTVEGDDAASGVDSGDEDASSAEADSGTDDAGSETDATAGDEGSSSSTGADDATDDDGSTDEGDADADSSSTTETGTEESTSSEDTSDADSGNDDDGECDPTMDEGCNCTGMDLLFTVPTSQSNDRFGRAMAAAMPTLIDRLIYHLPDHVDVRLAVTSNEMGFSASSISMGCISPSSEPFYVTLDNGDTGRPAAQGRLVQYQAKTFASFDSYGGVEGAQAAMTWMQGALVSRTDGSAVRMPTATAGWSADPRNDTVNGNFWRDRGTVMGVFVTAAGEDQTPDGVGGAILFEKMLARKKECGGARCMTGGGVLSTECFNGDPVGEFLDAMALPPPLGDVRDFVGEDPEIFETTFAEFAHRVADICWGIPP